MPTLKPARLFNNRNFAALWVGQMISAVGDYFILLAVPIFINRLTGSVGLVGLSFIISAIPALVLGPVAGVFVDRLDRRKVMIVSDLVRGGLMLTLLTIQRADQVWLLYVISFLVACAGQFFAPARAAAVPLIVTDPDDWLAANGLMQLISTIGMLAGPALAGFAIGLWGEPVAFVANSVGYLVSALAVLVMRVPHTTRGPARPAGAAANLPAVVEQVWADLREGLRYLLGNRVTLGVLICMTLAGVGFSTVNAIWIPYLQRAFGVGASGLGLADSALGVGMLAGGALLGFLAGRLRKSQISALSLIYNGLIYFAVGFSPAFWFIMLLQFLGGLAIIPMQSALTTIMQLAVPDLKRGRVSSAMNAFTTAGSVLSMGFAALLGEVIGLHNVFFLAGIFVAVAGLAGVWLLKEPEEPVLEPTIDLPAVD